MRNESSWYRIRSHWRGKSLYLRVSISLRVLWDLMQMLDGAELMVGLRYRSAKINCR
ncbi:hypothetical protein [Xenorhabdus bovienii]|uniref:hypothetical protein n=1 Tax=Xenorhabdus bovienii TaxID=40576 RepID=UPI000AB8A54B|nr:hypothetical protein [Xenorhabdus bovienii]